MSIEANSGIAGSGLEPDSALLSLIERRDQQALALLFERHSRLVYAIAFRVLADRAAAEDVMQDIFLQLWRHPATYQAVRNGLGGWLAVVSRNRAIDALRKRRPSDPIEDFPLASPTDLAKEVERHLLLLRVRETVAKLPEDQRRALELAFFEGCSHTQIAEKLQQPLGTVKTRIRAALQKLQEALRA